MSIQPRKRIAAGAIGIAITAAVLAPGSAYAADPTCSIRSGDNKLCINSIDAAPKQGMFGSIPIIGPILDSVMKMFGS